MKIVNLTPHAINLRNLDGELVTIAASGMIARCEEIRQEMAPLAGFAVTAITYGNVTDLPEPTEGVVYVVSRPVKSTAPHRTDLFCVGVQKRDQDGKVIEADGLSV